MNIISHTYETIIIGTHAFDDGVCEVVTYGGTIEDTPKLETFDYPWMRPGNLIIDAYREQAK